METIPTCMVLTDFIKKAIFNSIKIMICVKHSQVEKKPQQIENTCPSRLILFLQRVERDNILCELRGEKRVEAKGKNEGVPPRSGIKFEGAFADNFIIFNVKREVHVQFFLAY